MFASAERHDLNESQSRYKPPAIFNACVHGAHTLKAAAIPPAAKSPHVNEPHKTPNAVAKPILRPLLIELVAINRVAGPGVAVPTMYAAHASGKDS